MALYHISVVNQDLKDELFDLALDFIWKNTHCSAIRLNLFHITKDGTTKADPEIKKILKQRKFKWKTVQNDSQTGQRFEILEVNNTEHKD